MIINPHTEESHKAVQAQEIERIRKEIRRLPFGIRELIEQGEEIIEDSIEFQKSQNKDFNFSLYHLNVFNLNKNVSGEVMKYLAMLCAAAGFHHITISCDCYHSADSSNDVTYPNAISFEAIR
jgi:hypothetical protein